jgi:hypothetical protein
MSNLKAQDLQKRLQTPTALLVDEISMLSQEILALLEEAISKTAHECGHAREDWGGFPVVIMFGGDYQLPSMGKPGATIIPIISTKNTKGHHYMTQNQGTLQLTNLAEQVM